MVALKRAVFSLFLKRSIIIFFSFCMSTIFPIIWYLSIHVLDSNINYFNHRPTITNRKPFQRWTNPSLPQIISFYWIIYIWIGCFIKFKLTYKINTKFYQFFNTKNIVNIFFKTIHLNYLDPLPNNAKTILNMYILFELTFIKNKQTHTHIEHTFQIQCLTTFALPFSLSLFLSKIVTHVYSPSVTIKVENIEHQHTNEKNTFKCIWVKINTKSNFLFFFLFFIENKLWNQTIFSHYFEIFTNIYKNEIYFKIKNEFEIFFLTYLWQFLNLCRKSKKVYLYQNLYDHTQNNYTISKFFLKLKRNEISWIKKMNYLKIYVLTNEHIFLKFVGGFFIGKWSTFYSFAATKTPVPEWTIILPFATNSRTYSHVIGCEYTAK